MIIIFYCKSKSYQELSELTRLLLLKIVLKSDDLEYLL
jgi:hypothetical protein